MRSGEQGTPHLRLTTHMGFQVFFFFLFSFFFLLFFSLFFPCEMRGGPSSLLPPPHALYVPGTQRPNPLYSRPGRPTFRAPTSPKARFSFPSTPRPFPPPLPLSKTPTPPKQRKTDTGYFTTNSPPEGEVRRKKAREGGTFFFPPLAEGPGRGMLRRGMASNGSASAKDAESMPCRFLLFSFVARPPRSGE